MTGDAEKVRSLQVAHAVRQPESRDGSGPAAEAVQHEQRLEQSEHGSAAVGRRSEEDPDEQPGEWKRQMEK